MIQDPADAKAIFLAAIENHDPDQWDAYLDQACGDNAHLRQRVQQLLQAHRQLGSLHGPRSAAEEATIHFQSTRESPGTQIGPYRLLQTIGEGGMGIVYLAEQQKPVRRQVALKIVKPGMDTREVVARFETERQALALMDHPNIARVIDGDETDSGRPFFVMELVHGIPITDYCDQHEMNIRQP